MRWTLVAGLFLAFPIQAAAQAVNGMADWTYGHSAIDAGEQSTMNKSFAQNYTIGYRSIVWDPRFLQYTAELTFQKIGLTFGRQEGRSGNTGYKLGASLFQARPFPLSISASRSFGGESGNFPTAMPVRGGLVLPPGTAMPQFKTRVSTLGVNWQLATKGFPRTELAYRKGSSGASVGDLKVEQQDSTLSASMAGETARTRNTLRLHRTAFDNLAAQEFKQRQTDLNYELLATLGRRTKGNVRAGYRRTYSLFDTPPEFTDIGRGASLPPSGGDFGQYYAAGGVSYQAGRALFTDVTTSYDRSNWDQGSAGSLLLLSTTRYEPLGGLTLSATGTYGLRGQELGGSSLTVLTRNVQGGVAYSLARRPIQISLGAERGTGWHGGTTSQSGRTDSWTGRATAGSTALRWVELSLGYERARSTDDLFVFGNYWMARTRASARSRAIGRIRLDASWERSTVERGIRDTFSRTEFLTRNGGAQVDLGRGRRLSLTAGDFQNRTAYGTDSNQFYGLSYESYLFNGLRLSSSARREAVALRGIEQTGYYTIAQAEYRLRLFTFAVEHRYTNLDLAVSTRTGPFLFVGNQVLIRISRRFGFAL